MTRNAEVIDELIADVGVRGVVDRIHRQFGQRFQPPPVDVALSVRSRQQDGDGGIEPGGNVGRQRSRPLALLQPLGDQGLGLLRPAGMNQREKISLIG